MLCMCAGIFTPSGPMKYLSKGVGVVDAAGGGIIHCTAGIVTLVLLCFSNLGRARVETVRGTIPQRQLSAVFVSFGTALLWLTLILLHVDVTADWKQTDTLSVDEIVRSTLLNQILTTLQGPECYTSGTLHNCCHH